MKVTSKIIILIIFISGCGSTRIVNNEDFTYEDLNKQIEGDFALSTYEWEWASYWLAFKRKMNKGWFAPPAYYALGQIHGHTILRFRIDREGQMSDLKVLRQVGPSSLELSSVNAVEAVFPFLPLPENFPDEYLEVTLKMRYPNLREYNKLKD